MSRPLLPSELTRRRWLLSAAAALGVVATPILGHADDDGDEDDNDSAPRADVTFALAQTGLQARVVVIGGGMAGATCAKYLRLWGGAGVEVTLVEPRAAYTSNIMSNLVLNGGTTMAALDYGYSRLASRYGVTVRQGRVAALDPAARVVRLDDGTELPYDRVVAAPGIEFDDAWGLVGADYDARTPHAWQAGAQTTLLRDQIAQMSSGDRFVMVIPRSPYRCPPGPYERACLVADLLKTSGRGASEVLVLDENLTIQAERENFTAAFEQIHAGVIRYEPGVTGVTIDPTTLQVRYLDGVGAPQAVQARVVNPIAPHRAAGSGAAGWLARAGLANSADGRWAVVNVLSYESTAVAGVHVIGDAASCGLPKAGHVGNQEAKICADAIVRLLGGGQPDPTPVANSACYSPITAGTASWLTAVYQYDAAQGRMVVAANGGNTAGASAVEAASISARNFRQMHTWFDTLMRDSFA